jgi:superfamily II DNA or RNA helicase
VLLEAADPVVGFDGAYTLRVRLDDGSLDETQVTDEDLASGLIEPVEDIGELGTASDFFDFIEAHRIQLAYAHDPNFAVSLSGVRGLPHQIVAVYRHMLPQGRLRFVLADDPGAGKTIMAGLLIKELRLRGVADRVLVLSPAPLTIQWQDEMHEKFEEQFELIDSHKVKGQLGGNPWQQVDRAIASMDFAKREEVLPELLRADWDFVIVDEAHKCSAVSRHDARENREKTDKTSRYQLAEELSKRCERLVLLTATPHSGDKSRFQNFLKLLDPDQFALPDLSKEQIGREDTPYFLRRQKEDLKDEKGAPLFVPREVLLQPFRLSAPELHLYEEVTSYIQQFLGQTGGRRGSAVALARTVLQRRLASSLGAIRSSLRKRAERITGQIEEVENLPSSKQAARLAELSLIPEFDVEEDEEDATEEEQEAAASGVVVAETIDQMRTEVRALDKLVEIADRTIASGEESKLGALRSCLERAELSELKDGRGKLLIFTEHRDTLDYLERNLKEWGFNTCSIHGGINPRDRKAIQQEFHQSKEICVATEAAGEGINLQFCHLMINYDLPWNPVRLEQRMGRIHRIGQQATCVIFNFCAENTVEGMLLGRLLQKLEEMKKALGGRVYDVIGDVLSRNQIDFERMLRESLLNPTRMNENQLEIEGIDPERLEEYEREVGVAQATKHVDMAWVAARDWESAERRLMPEFVEQFFSRACDQVGVRLEQRADGLWRIEHVPQALRSDRLGSVKRLGRPQAEYRKLTCLKEQRGRAEHEDAVLLSPGHPLYAAVRESLLDKLGSLEQRSAPFVAPWVTEPYAIHFFTHSVRGFDMSGKQEDVHGELVALTQSDDGFELVPVDVLHDLTPVDMAPVGLRPPDRDSIELAMNFVKLRVQQDAAAKARAERVAQATLRSEYLRESMEAQRRVLEAKWSELNDRVYRGEDGARLALDEADRRLKDLERRRDDKLKAFESLGVVRPGPVLYLGSALIGPPGGDEPAARAMRNDSETELAAMEWAMDFERSDGWDPDDVSERRDGSGFDIRSVRRDERNRPIEVRRIEVKGRAPERGDVSLCRTEWIAANRHGDSYWLYVIYGAKSKSPRAVRIQNPAKVLRDSVNKVSKITAYYIPGDAIEGAV